MPGFLCDLHIHSCLSPCGDGDMTPYNLVNMAKVMGLDILALTDHNSSLNCPAAARAARDAGIAFVPGMELTTSEEVHVVCLFPDVDSSLRFSGYVSERLPKIKNRLDIFGEQLIMDELDGVLGCEKNLLSTASFISISEVFSLVSDFGGVCYPAHIDRPSFSVTANLGSFDESWGFINAELSAFAQTDKLAEAHPLLKNMRLLRASDAHFLENVGSASTELELPCASPQAVIDLLKSNYHPPGM